MSNSIGELTRLVGRYQDLKSKVEELNRKSKIVHKKDPCPCGSGKMFKYCCMNLRKA